MGNGFEALHFEAELEGPQPTVRFEDGSISADRRLLFYRTTRDAKSGPESAIAEYAGAEKTRLNGISRVLLKPSRLTITFGGRMPEILGEGRQFVVTFRASSGELGQIRRALKQVFRGTGLFVDDSVTGLALVGEIVFGPPTPTSEMLVVPTYVGILGAIVGGLSALPAGPWWIPVGVLGGAALGIMLGFVKGALFRPLHKY
jgi:hypothetical protein